MSSNNDLKSHDREVREFLEAFEQERKNYLTLLSTTKEQCNKLLEQGSMKAIVHGRVKDVASLTQKLDLLKETRIPPGNEPNESPDFQDWVASGKKIHEHPDMGDLAGIRIGLYFPDDVAKIAKKIEAHFYTRWLFGTVRGGRDSVSAGRNADIQQHVKGPWRSLGPRGTDDEHWEHSGYKSWQIVVGLKQPEELRRFRIEIQVGTVVTQAWAEVQHNIIYKRSASVLATPTMKRMIDAINGLAITTDIMLKELERGLEAAEKEAAQKPFKNGAELIDWFELTYLNSMSQEVRASWRRAQSVVAAAMLVERKQHDTGGRALSRENCMRLAELKYVVRDGVLQNYHLRSDITQLLWPSPGRAKAQSHEVSYHRPIGGYVCISPNHT
ncbi:hypothetical protein NPX13_g3906 [Xylaria arbuscula]|uniref:RelA/SpoT domain-containing protein n=1 Tax=Xylaria arbuscula TaxID=114810 RepID=A0A9W8NHU7_9PEZI|nr:hypothetical protein NPX13_g3906 [Xylaria arbuscula]